MPKADHFYTTSDAERDNAANSCYISEGEACFVFTPPERPTALHRLFNPNSGDHFYTTSDAERDNAVANDGFTFEGEACFVFTALEAGTVPLHRLFNPNSGDHFYTTSDAERDNAVANAGYTLEGEACFVFAAQRRGTVPLHRLFQGASVTVKVHFKSLLPMTANLTQFIDNQFNDMSQLFATGGIAVARGTTEDLSSIAALQPLGNLNVGQCLRGAPTANQNALFANRNNVGNNELVVYIVSTLIGGTGNFLGCATFPTGQPGAAIVRSSARWLTAHEVAHVLGLNHVCEFPSPSNPSPSVVCVTGSSQSDNLMFPTVAWTNPPPDISASEFSTMLGSSFARSC
jgi:hypothetical protein